FLRGRLGLAAVALILIAASAAGYAGARWHPNPRPPTGTGLEGKVISVFADPTVKDADDRLAGDLLIERFYILDETTGQQYVADFLKGTITAVQNDGTEAAPHYSFLLDVPGLRGRDNPLKAYVRLVSQPAAKT